MLLTAFLIEAPRTLPPKTYMDRIRSTFHLGSLNVSFKNSQQPRLAVQDRYVNATELVEAYSSSCPVQSVAILATKNTVTVEIKGTITEQGSPVLSKHIMVVLINDRGVVVERVHTDLEGNFIFYDIPQNLSLMAVAIDHSYKYNAVILSKILTVDNGVA